MVIKMRGDDIRRHIVSRMLYRRKGIDVLPHRKYDDTAWMLAGTSAHTGTPCHDPVDLAVSLSAPSLLIVILHIAKGRLIGQGSDRPRPEGLSGTENNLRIFVCLTLVFTGKV